MEAKLIHKKDFREVYDDGKYIIKKTLPDAFDFETYKHFQEQNPCLVKVHSFEDGIIIMDKVHGVYWTDYRKQAKMDELWYICNTHRYALWKRYFDFMVRNKDTTEIDPRQRIFFHADGVPGNVIVNNGQPTYVDPDGTCWMQWDMFLQKLNEHHFVWWNEYTNIAHRGMN